jgi:hypothetical protein
MRHIQVEPLRREEARELAVLLVGSRPTTDAEIDAIVDDAHGHPQFIDELVRHRGADASAKVLKLGDALWSRVTELDPAARRLLELVAIAGSPITQEIAADAAAIDIAQLFRSGARSARRSSARRRGTRGGSSASRFRSPGHRGR